jgi:hypothetical protein
MTPRFRIATTNAIAASFTRQCSRQAGQGLMGLVRFRAIMAVKVRDHSMRYLVPFVLATLCTVTAHANDECRDAAADVVEREQCVTGSSVDDRTLPADAMVQVNDLKAQMRYFTAIGFHKQSKEKRDEIAAIYAQHGVLLPDEFRQ